MTPYMVDDHTALLNLKEKWKVMELKDFVLDPYFAQVRMAYNQQQFSIQCAYLGPRFAST
eukprot:COSAG05_NODE_1210_length_5500_cov_84.214960_5_plen_60_part_00